MPRHHRLNKRELKRIRRLQEYYRNDNNAFVSYTYKGYGGNACGNYYNNGYNNGGLAGFYERDYFDLFNSANYR